MNEPLNNIQEGYTKKGGVNKPEDIERPEPPYPQKPFTLTVDICKYFKPLPKEGDYEFQEQLTDHLLGDIILANETIQTLLKENREVKREMYRLTQELKELSQVRKDMPNIQQPYVLLYRQLKHELCVAESKLLQIEEFCTDNDDYSILGKILCIIQEKK